MDEMQINSGVEKANFSVSVTNKEGEELYATSKGKKLSQFTIKQLLEYIDTLDIEPEVMAKLKQAARQYPQQALPSFRKNIKNHIHNIKKNMN